MKISTLGSNRSSTSVRSSKANRKRHTAFIAQIFQRFVTYFLNWSSFTKLSKFFRINKSIGGPISVTGSRRHFWQLRITWLISSIIKKCNWSSLLHAGQAFSLSPFACDQVKLFMHLGSNILLSFFIFSDSYIGMDQQLDLKLDVKEAPAIPQYSGNILRQVFSHLLTNFIHHRTLEHQRIWRRTSRAKG